MSQGMWLRYPLVLICALSSLSFPIRSAGQFRWLPHRAMGSTETDSSLTARLVRLIRRQEQQGGQQLGVTVISLKTDSLVFAYHGSRPMVPASNAKLLLTAAAWSNWDDSLVARLRQRLGRRNRRLFPNPLAARGSGARPRRTARVRGRPPRKIGTASRDEPLLVGLPERDSLSGLNGYDLLCRIQRWSDNYVANRLLDCLAERTGLKPQEVVEHFLAGRGIWTGGLNVVDGSGRSPRNRVAPLSIAQVLRTMHQMPGWDAYLRSLARAGVDGTLRRHSLGQAGRVAAKTGSIYGTFSLSGYLLGEADTLAFSIVLNRCYSKAAAFRFFEVLLHALGRGTARPGASSASLNPGFGPERFRA
jgi:D-alanyl-D-alanine carboxypeptidase